MTTRKAFTLLELLVVVLIIGILAAIAVPQYQKAVGKIKLMQYLMWVRKIQQANSLYYLANSRYATDIRDLELDFTANATKFARGEWTQSDTYAAYYANGTNCGPNSSAAYGICMVRNVIGGGINFYLIATPKNISCVGYNALADSICRSLSNGNGGSQTDNGYASYTLQF